jgi:2-C-methyl-D-erythritol 4-phosphate cytidylyltransferase
VTDEAMAMERMGAHPALVEGREDNLKVTTPADLRLMELLFESMKHHTGPGESK